MRSSFVILGLALILSACRLMPASFGEPTIRPALSPTSIPQTIDGVATGIPPAGAPTPIPTRPPATITAVTAEPSPAVKTLDATPIAGAAARVATALELREGIPPLRDDARLAVAYLGADASAATPQPVTTLLPGEREMFFIGNVDSNTINQIEAELMSVGENAYFWFDLGDGSVKPSPADLAEVTSAFDRIFDSLYAYFGVSEPAGGRVHIVHASPNALCDNPDLCRLAGYFSPNDLNPKSINPQSNERAMFVMNTQQFGGDNYLDDLAHELRHMLGSGYDAGEEDWMIEGGALLAEDLVGFSSTPKTRGSLFLENPDQQLNSWTNDNRIPYYGQGYLVSRFLYDRLGEQLFREYLFSREPGLAAVDDVSEANDLGITGEGLWLDWLAAMALHNSSAVPDEFQWGGPELGPITTTLVNNLPATIMTTVNQYAADYYELPSSGKISIDFSGGAEVSLLGVAAESGESIWYAQRANDSNPRLTRVVDLQDVSQATLQYKVFADIEQGYDFAYVATSSDGGQTWQALEAGQMQGESQSDDPAERALADRFYTGQIGKWVNESIDLSPFAGQKILLRFEYVTDPILTFGGFALDDIAIPEIGFLDDAEALDPDWIAEGFTRATADLPQHWWLQLITFDPNGHPSVERISVPEDGHAEFAYQAVAGERRPILIVAAVAPETLQQGTYQLDFAAP